MKKKKNDFYQNRDNIDGLNSGQSKPLNII